MDPDAWQTASLSIEPSQYGFAVVYTLAGSQPAVCCHRQKREKAFHMLDLNVKLLVGSHGWTVDRTDESTTYSAGAGRPA